MRRPRALLAAAGVGAAVVLAGAGFLASGGLHHSGGDTTLISNASQGVPDDGAPGGEGRTGRQGAGGYGDGDRAGQGGMPDTARFTAGRITAISGSTLTLDGMRGDTVKVTTTSATKVTGDGGGTSGLSSLKVGQLVMVIGTRQSDGSYQAAVISTRLGHDRDGDEGRSDGSRRSPQDPSNQGGQNQGGQNQGGQNQGSQNQSGSDQGA